MHDEDILDLDSNTIDPNRRIKAKTKKVFVLFIGINILLILINILTINYQTNSREFMSKNSMMPLYRLITMTSLLFFIYRGKNWAGIILTFLLLWSFFSIGVKFIYSFLLTYYLGIIVYLIGLVMYGYIFYFINVDKEFQLFFRNQKIKNQNSKD